LGAGVPANGVKRSWSSGKAFSPAARLFRTWQGVSHVAGAVDRVAFVIYSEMQNPEITAYLKTTCGWSAGVRAVLSKYNLKYTEKDIIQNPAFRWEMETKSGQPLSPCVEINGTMLPDVSGEEVESYLIENRLVQSSEADAGVPLNAPCPPEQHASSEVKLRL
jgi:monothiol glutaredoxin